MRIVTDTNNPAAAAGEELAVHLELNQHIPVLLLLSGGSAFALLKYVPTSVLGPHLTIAMLDERWSTDPAVNNFAQLSVTEFYARAVAAGVQFFDSRPESGEPASELAMRYEVFLESWHKTHEDGVVIATLGMGEDGHTAGIFPGFVERLSGAGKMVEAYTLPEGRSPYPERVTVTPNFLRRHIAVAVGYVVGGAKRAVLSQIYEGAVSSATYPAALWRDMKKVIVVTDQIL